jgi:hypothetical protein
MTSTDTLAAAIAALTDAAHHLAAVALDVEAAAVAVDADADRTSTIVDMLGDAGRMTTTIVARIAHEADRLAAEVIA